MGQLRLLHCTVSSTAAPGPLPLVLPPRLVSLNLGWTGFLHPAEQTNNVIAALPALLHLEELSLEFCCTNFSDVRLAPLRAVRSLRRLKLGYWKLELPRRWTDEQWADLRALDQLDELAFRPFSTALLHRLLAPGHTLRLRSLSGSEQIYSLELSEPTVALLRGLPTLTHGDFSACTSKGVAALRVMPQLTELHFQCGTRLPNGDLFPAALRSCSQLQTLRMGSLKDDDRFEIPLLLSSAALGDCFAGMSLLQSLTIDGAQLDSLAFLGTGALPRTLTALHLIDITPRLPPSELRHVLVLGALQSLYVGAVLSSSADEITLTALTVPSRALPNLVDSQLVYAVSDF